MTEEYWDSRAWKAWSTKLYEKTITYQDKAGKKFFLDSLKIVEHGDTYAHDVDKAAYKFEKGEQVYLVIEDFLDKLPFNVESFKEGYLKESDKTLIKLVTKPQSVKIKQIKHMDFDVFILLWNHLEHDSETVRLFLNMLAFSMYWKPIKLAVSGKRGAMKNANLNLYRQIFRDLVVVKTPTKAKFQRLIYYYKKIIIDEITSNPDKHLVRMIEDIVMSLGDGSTDMEKHSVAQNKAMDNMDIDETSLLFTFNTLQEIKQSGENNPFFDELWRNLPAIKDRLPCIKLPEGKVRTVFKNMTKKRAMEIAEENFDKMKAWADTASYYSVNLDKHMHGWRIGSLYVTERHRAAIEGLLDTMDAFSKTQEEFDKWIAFLNSMIIAYDEDVARLSDFKNDIRTPDVKEELVEENTYRGGTLQ